MSETSSGSIGRAGSSGGATIGASIFVKGRIEGKEDLVIRGRVEGTVKLPKNTVIIAAGSEVKADVTARSIQVEGQVEGTLEGGRDVTVRAGGRVMGDIVAPRVSLDTGAHFTGSVDMKGADSAVPDEPAAKAT